MGNIKLPRVDSIWQFPRESNFCFVEVGPKMFWDLPYISSIDYINNIPVSGEAFSLKKCPLLWDNITVDPLGIIKFLYGDEIDIMPHIYLEKYATSKQIKLRTEEYADLQ